MRRFGVLGVFAVAVMAAAISPLAQDGAVPPVWPGYQGHGVTLLPNGWRIAPEGRHVTVGGLPMNLVPSPDGRFVAISTSGWAKPALSIFDTRTLQIVSRVDVDHTWLGLVWHPDGTRLFASGSSENVIYQFAFLNGRVTSTGSISLGAAEVHPGRDVILNAGFVAGLAISADGRRLFGTQAPAGSTPNGVALSPDGATLAIANADNNTVTLADVAKPGASSVLGWIPVGWYPTNVLFDRDGSRIFVLDGKGLTGMANPRG